LTAKKRKLGIIGKVRRFSGHIIYRFKLNPNSNKDKTLDKHLNLGRGLYNAFLEQRILAYGMGMRINYSYQQDRISEFNLVFAWKCLFGNYYIILSRLKHLF
jgi:hypothetical protein